ncbi:undecaprenyl-phosphate galactose phosphotransferase WbaP [Thermus amyloliquefaciens]|uniref:undecaprenyl-phosphate galactose phosphotransferase WbaP n=1 Tax=Thermus amyloliquefaciens TaxID=1449080 RepID=UPI000A6CF371|nr:undecaprenyl-phosphate galactose phosphotransferase WbaP [Thermus amyloliquefaciens]
MQQERVLRIPRREPIAKRLGKGAAVLLGLLVVDLLALELSLLFAYVLREALDTLLFNSNKLLRLFFPSSSLSFALLLFPLGYALAGLYPGYGLPPVERIRRKVLVTLLMFLALIAWEWLFLREGWSRGVLLLALGFALVLPSLFEALAREGLVRLELWGTPVLILGAGRTGALVARALLRERALGLKPIGFLDDDPTKWEKQIEGLPVLGALAEAGGWVQEGVRTAVLAMPGVGRKRLLELLEGLPFPKVVLVPDLLETQSLWVSVRDLGGILGLEMRNNLLFAQNKFIKRAMDLGISVPLFLASLPLMAVLALLIKLVDRGPVLFSQERIGYGCKPFRIWKLRTMSLDAEERLKVLLEKDPKAKEEWQKFRKLKNDPRLLPVVGKILRKMSLDELPQLWNVIRGDMSLVGPRPAFHEELEAYYGPLAKLYCSVRPGLTGPWQIMGRNQLEFAERVALEAYYVRNWSPWLDLYILARTVWVVLTSKGAH